MPQIKNKPPRFLFIFNGKKMADFWGPKRVQNKHKNGDETGRTAQNEFYKSLKERIKVFKSVVKSMTECDRKFLEAPKDSLHLEANITR